MIYVGSKCETIKYMWGSKRKVDFLKRFLKYWSLKKINESLTRGKIQNH